VQFPEFQEIFCPCLWHASYIFTFA